MQPRPTIEAFDIWLAERALRLTASPWLADQDANPMWPKHVCNTLADLRGRLGHGV
ncbi:MAG: hypothetical protein GXP55_22645 [Deltaproteobacteria bacterium]|jgi:hypothetical protein|nr:hypothetical protein [Deltaproteobacteria bacterium]